MAQQSDIRKKNRLVILVILKYITLLSRLFLIRSAEFHHTSSYIELFAISATE